jgi:hypothetical protein
MDVSCVVVFVVVVVVSAGLLNVVDFGAAGMNGYHHSEQSIGRGISIFL